jgi:hypothetical protein
MAKKMFYIKTYFMGNIFWRHSLMQELCTFLKSAQNCATFDTILRKKCQLLQGWWAGGTFIGG